MAEPASHRAVEAVWRIESARLIAGIMRIVRDVGLAEDIAQDALVSALEQWPTSGIPDNPGAWLMTIARRRAIDSIRRTKLAESKAAEIGRDIEVRQDTSVSDIDNALDDDVGDDILRLVFISCHPILSHEARVALTLRILGGLSKDEIARAFLVSEATIAQRVVRAKRTLHDANIPFELPAADARAERLSSVLEVIYLIFNEGYAATSGDDWTRPALCDDALRLGRVLAELMPADAEVHGLVALMELQASRMRARVGPAGEPILMLDQNRSRWDQLLINRGLAELERAEQLGGAKGPYTLQAAIAACHARARAGSETDWPAIANLYALLAEVTPSPIVDLNRAVAVGMAVGPGAALQLVDVLVNEGSLDEYHLLSAVRGDLLAKLGRNDEAREEFTRAGSLTRNNREQALLLARASACRI